MTTGFMNRFRTSAPHAHEMASVVTECGDEQAGRAWLRAGTSIRRGIGLIEIAMGLGIAALIIAAALAYFGQANSGRQVQDALGEIGSIQQVTRALVQGQSDYTGITQVVIAGARQLPNKYCVGCSGAGPVTGLTSAFNGPVIVAASNTNQNFDVALNNVPRDACSRLASSDLGTGMMAVGVAASDGTGALANTAMVARLATNPNEAYGAVAANAACAAPFNSLAWRFN